MIVARLVTPVSEDKVPSFLAKVVAREKINQITNNLTLDISGEVSQNHNMPKMFYKDLGMVAKHYRINEVGRHRVKRHYTVSNCMHPEIYAKYLAALRGETMKKEDFTQIN